MQRIIAPIAALSLVTACGSSNPAPTPPKEIKVHGEAQQQLSAASETDRNIGLKRAIYDAGSSCARLTSSKFITEYKNLAMWRASCADGRNWAVFIAPEGSAQVRPCTDLKELKLPECDAAANPGSVTKTLPADRTPGLGTSKT